MRLADLNPLLQRLAPVFVYAGLFSLIANLLLLVPSLYMLQVFDRVLTHNPGLSARSISPCICASRPSTLNSIPIYC